MEKGNKGKSFQIVEEEFLGGHSGGVTPDPIPNSEVKPSSADGTAWETVWESRTSPGFNLKPLDLLKRLF